MGFVEDLAARLKLPLPGAEAQLKMSPAFAKASARLTPRSAKASARLTPTSAKASARLTPASARPLLKDAPADVRHAAALILLYPGGGRAEASAEAGGYSIPLTLRRDDLLHHPGQISLPGGGIDENELPEAASLREAEEEIGVDPSTVRIIGALTPLYVMVSGYVVTPFVGVVDKRPEFRPEAREVAAILEVPVSQLKDPARRMWGNRTREGYLIDFPYFDVGHEPTHQVWGATAMMLSEFVELL